MKIYDINYAMSCISDVLQDTDYKIVKNRLRCSFYVTYHGIRLFTLVKPARSRWIFLSDVTFNNKSINAFCFKDDLTDLNAALAYIDYFIKENLVGVWTYEKQWA